MKRKYIYLHKNLQFNYHLLTISFILYYITSIIYTRLSMYNNFVIKFRYTYSFSINRLFE